jgi:hypothetical protein
MQVFKDNILDETFRKDGYVVIKNALSCDFSSFYQYFNSQQSDIDAPFYSAMWSNNPEYRYNVDAKIRTLLSPLCNEYLTGYVPFFTDMLVKKPGLKNKLNWHQDWTFVDETKYQTVFIWAPLVDIGRLNGGVMILPESHRYFKLIRGTNFSSPVSNVWLEQAEKKYARYISMNRGDVLFFNQAVMHASAPNISLKNRIAIGLNCIPQGAETFHFHYDIRDKMYKKYAIDSRFTQEFSFNQDFKRNLEQNSFEVHNARLLEVMQQVNGDYDDKVCSRYEYDISHPAGK